MDTIRFCYRYKKFCRESYNTSLKTKLNHGFLNPIYGTVVVDWFIVKNKQMREGWLDWFQGLKSWRSQCPWKV